MYWWKRWPCSLFTQISIFLWKIFHVWPQKRSLSVIRALNLQKLFCSSSISFFYSVQRWFPRKFVTNDFSDCQVDSSPLLSASSDVGSFISSHFWGMSNIPILSFPIIIRYPPCSLPSLSSSLILTWYIMVESVFCSVQEKKETEHNASQVLIFVLTPTLIAMILVVSPVVPKIYKKGCFVYPPWNPRTTLPP